MMNSTPTQLHAHPTYTRTRRCGHPPPARSSRQHHQQQRLLPPPSQPLHQVHHAHTTQHARRRRFTCASAAVGGSDSGYDSNSGDGPRTNDEEQFGQLSSPKASDKSSKPVGFLKQWQQDSKQMQGQLKSLGAAGIIAYGLFNTLYYTVAFSIGFNVANVPSGLGWSAAARKAAEVFAIVWAGSQVTKLLRAGAALACAPLIDRGLDRLGLRDKKRKAYLLIVLGCVLLASAVMCALIASHA